MLAKSYPPYREIPTCSPASEGVLPLKVLFCVPSIFPNHTGVTERRVQRNLALFSPFRLSPPRTTVAAALALRPLAKALLNKSKISPEIKKPTDHFSLSLPAVVKFVKFAALSYLELNMIFTGRRDIKSILPFKIQKHQKTFLFGELCFVWAFSMNKLGEITLVKVRHRTNFLLKTFAPAPTRLRTST
jgi:hypothetical protein